MTAFTMPTALQDMTKPSRLVSAWHADGRSSSERPPAPPVNHCRERCYANSVAIDERSARSTVQKAEARIRAQEISVTA